MPHTFHAEYDTARKKNQVPWGVLEGGVLMEQEVGQFEPCNAVTQRAVGEGPCNPATGICKNSTTEGTTGPIACPTKDSVREHAPVAGCISATFQNGDLDFDGTSYQKRTWPNGRATAR